MPGVMVTTLNCSSREACGAIWADNGSAASAARHRKPKTSRNAGERWAMTVVSSEERRNRSNDRDGDTNSGA